MLYMVQITRGYSRRGVKGRRSSGSSRLIRVILEDPEAGVGMGRQMRTTIESVSPPSCNAGTKLGEQMEQDKREADCEY